MRCSTPRKSRKNRWNSRAADTTTCLTSERWNTSGSFWPNILLADGNDGAGGSGIPPFIPNNPGSRLKAWTANDESFAAGFCLKVSPIGTEQRVSSTWVRSRRAPVLGLQLREALSRVGSKLALQHIYWVDSSLMRKPVHESFVEEPVIGVADGAPEAYGDAINGRAANAVI
jgi:hypothetical protein